MSMRSWTADGFGVLADNVNRATTKAKVEFTKKYLPNAYEDLIEALEDEEFEIEEDKNVFIEDWFNEYEDDYVNQGFSSIFADAINENEEEFDVDYYCGEYSEECAIMYKSRMPWLMSDRVKAMSANDMRAVFRKYLDELDLKDVEVDWVSVEFYG